ncbi:M17 family peptidase N-terminal domain-containing protein, partial [Saccharomonospora saliphila]|uniref:M17 family peptidase N-terminal domain-containing protein n=1 Tax=Saccharomonospora saliphila TaxID=369829 RepID=UPI0006628CE8
MARSPLPPIPTRLPDVTVGTTHRRGAALAEVVTEDGDTPLADVLADLGATRRAGEVHALSGPDGPRWVVGAGSGSSSQYRTAAAAFVRAVEAASTAGVDTGGVSAVAVQVRLPDTAGPDEYAAFATGALLGGYRYRVSGSDDGVRGARAAAAERPG